MDGVTAYGLAVNLGPAVAPPPAPAGAPVAGAPHAGRPFEALFRVDRWESAAFGALVVIGLALYTNALLDAS